MATLKEQIEAAEGTRDTLLEHARLAYRTWQDMDAQVDRLNEEIRELKRRQHDEEQGQ